MNPYAFTNKQKSLLFASLAIAILVVTLVLSGCTSKDDVSSDQTGNVIDRGNHITVVWEEDAGEDMDKDTYLMFVVPEMNITCISYDGGDDGGIYCQPGIKENILRYGY